MKKVYENMEYTRVGYFQSILEAEGIRTTVQNYGVSTAMGELPFTEVFPELWVLDDQDCERALRLIRKELEEPPKPKIGEWTCSKCGSTVDAGYMECWKCGASK